MTSRPMAVLNEAAAREILRLARLADKDSPADLGRALADEILARGGWKANSCQPLLRAYEISCVDGFSDNQPCTSCEEPTGNEDTFCNACKLDELEQECDRLRARLVKAGPTAVLARVLAKHQLAYVLPGGVACTCGAELAALNAPLDDGMVKGEPLALAVHQLQEMERDR